MGKKIRFSDHCVGVEYDQSHQQRNSSASNDKLDKITKNFGMDLSASSSRIAFSKTRNRNCEISEHHRYRSQVAFANLLRPFFKYYDRKSIKEDDILLVNSYATREKVKRAYNRDSQVLFPPVAKFHGTVRKIPLPKNYEQFFLQVGRVRGYKGYDFLLDVFKDSGFRLIMVGEGTETIQTLAGKLASDLRLGFLKTPGAKSFFSKSS